MNYKPEDLTEWFDPSVKPTRVGSYNASINYHHKVFRWWDGENWSVAYLEDERPTGMIQRFKDGVPNIPWRGLKNKPE